MRPQWETERQRPGANSHRQRHGAAWPGLGLGPQKASTGSQLLMQAGAEGLWKAIGIFLMGFFPVFHHVSVFIFGGFFWSQSRTQTGSPCVDK